MRAVGAPERSPTGPQWINSRSTAEPSPGPGGDWRAGDIAAWEISPLSIGSLEISAKPLSLATKTITGLQFTLSAAQRTQVSQERAQNYSLELTLAGSQSLLFLPLADTTQVTLQADWPHPEFIGQFLPIERSITDEGTQSRWQLLGLNRPYGDQWPVLEMAMHQLNMAGFGMRLETPVDSYQRSERSVKYGFLFISLSFFTLFLFEVMTGQPLHPVSYILTGGALAVFYLVLLALSEYLPFIWAFTIAAGLLILIVTLYSGVVLGRRRRGYLVGTMMGLTYSLLYVLVIAQHIITVAGLTRPAGGHRRVDVPDAACGLVCLRPRSWYLIV